MMSFKPISLTSLLFLSEEVEKPRVTNSILQRILSEKTPSKQAALAQANLKLIGTGSSRFVYDIGDNKVLKLSPLKTGQTKKEVETWKCAVEASQTEKFFFAEVYDYDQENFHWLIAEKIPHVFDSTESVVEFVINKILQDVNALSEKQYSRTEIENELLFSKQASRSQTIWNNFLNALDIAAEGGNPSSVLAISPWFNSFVAAIRSCGINIKDFWEDNMGVRSNGEFVILDFGA